MSSLLAAPLAWGEFLQQLILTILPVLVGWLGHRLGSNGRPPGPLTINPPT